MGTRKEEKESAQLEADEAGAPERKKVRATSFVAVAKFLRMEQNRITNPPNFILSPSLLKTAKIDD